MSGLSLDGLVEVESGRSHRGRLQLDLRGHLKWTAKNQIGIWAITKVNETEPNLNGHFDHIN